MLRIVTKRRLRQDDASIDMLDSIVMDQRRQIEELSSSHLRDVDTTAEVIGRILTSYLEEISWNAPRSVKVVDLAAVQAMAYEVISKRPEVSWYELYYPAQAWRDL